MQSERRFGRLLGGARSSIETDMQGNGGNPDIWKYSKATQFKKGHRGPRGRRKDIHNVAELARTFTREAIDTLHEIMKDKKATANA
jgi:hypothetical protein